jgi:hypothetical protein
MLFIAVIYVIFSIGTDFLATCGHHVNVLTSCGHDQFYIVLIFSVWSIDFLGNSRLLVALCKIEL